MKRIVVLVSGIGSNLEALIVASNMGEIKGKIVCVISDKQDADALKKAKSNGIDVEIVNENVKPFETSLISVIQRCNADLILLAGFMKILSGNFVKQFEGRILNIHPSLLPKYKGLDTHRRVLEAGEIVHGCSVHFVTSELDSGPVIAQTCIEIRENDTPKTLEARVLREEHLLYKRVVALFCEDCIKLQDGRCYFL